MKFRIHVFREFREAYEVDAEDADAALKYVDANMHDLSPVQTEMQDYLPHALIDPLLPDGGEGNDRPVCKELT